MLNKDLIFDAEYQKLLNLSKLEIQNLNQLKKFNKFEWLQRVGNMKIGQHFGELALINDAPRSATVTALTNCEFAILGRNDFDLVIKKNEAK